MLEGERYKTKLYIHNLGRSCQLSSTQWQWQWEIYHSESILSVKSEDPLMTWETQVVGNTALRRKVLTEPTTCQVFLLSISKLWFF